MTSEKEDLQEVAPEPFYVPAEPKGEPKPVPHHHVWRSSAIKTLRFVQKYSAYGIVAFAGLHLTSTVVLPPISLRYADSAFMAGRAIYQSPWTEPLVVYAPLTLHIASGLILHTYRTIKHYRDTGKLNLFVTYMAKSGWALTGILGLHLALMRWGPQVKLGDSSLLSLSEYVGFGLRARPYMVSISLLLVSGLFFFHAVPGLARYLKLTIKRSKLSIVTICGFAASCLSLVALKKQDAVSGWLAEQYQLAYSLIQWN